jgi:hypothetical protein
LQAQVTWLQLLWHSCVPLRSIHFGAKAFLTPLAHLGLLDSELHLIL